MLLVGPETRRCPLRTAAPGWVMVADGVLWALQPAGPFLLPSQASVFPCCSHGSRPDLSTLSSPPTCCPTPPGDPTTCGPGMAKAICREPPHILCSLFLSLSFLENECLWLRLTSPLPDEDCHPITWGGKASSQPCLTVRSPPHHAFPFTGKPPGGIVYRHWKRLTLTSLDTDILFSSKSSGFLYLCCKKDIFFSVCTVQRHQAWFCATITTIIATELLSSCTTETSVLIKY